MKKRTLLAGVGFGAAVAAAGALGSVFSPGGNRRDWYEHLQKPALTPPSIAFPIVWTALYAVMAVSAFRVWREGGEEERNRALKLWATQLGLNAAWSPIFFGAMNPEIALADLVALFVAIAAYTNEARKIDKPAAWMMAPYLGWVAFAGHLNKEFARLN